MIKAPAPQGRRTGQITGFHSPGFYLLRDLLGRAFLAASGEQWRVGDSVAVVSGQIVGRAGTAPAIKTYSV